MYVQCQPTPLAPCRGCATTQQTQNPPTPPPQERDTVKHSIRSRSVRVKGSVEYIVILPIIYRNLAIQFRLPIAEFARMSQHPADERSEPSCM